MNLNVYFQRIEYLAASCHDDGITGRKIIVLTIRPDDWRPHSSGDNRDADAQRTESPHAVGMGQGANVEHEVSHEESDERTNQKTCERGECRLHRGSLMSPTSTICDPA